MIDGALKWGTRLAFLAGMAMLSGCVTRPPNTDLFGRPLTPGDHQADAAPPPAPAPSPVTTNWPPTSRAPATVWTPAPVATDARIVTADNYTVVAGDTLRGIGNRTGAGAEAIALANGLVEPFVIRPGQQLRIPAGRYHEVRAGQTGIAIARAYGVVWGAVVTENGLVPPYLLRVGQRLRLPQGPATDRPMTIEERAQAFTLDIDDIVTGGGAPAGATPPPRPPAAAPSRFSWPIDGRVIRRFGPAAAGRVNEGIDISAPIGTPVRAAADGVVVYAGDEIGLFGGLILIDHGGGWVSAYGHLRDVGVVQGTRVTAGSVIAASGDSGQVQQPQLHFELRQNRRPVDPITRLPAR